MTGNSTHENVLLHDAHMCQAKIHLSGMHGSYPKLLTSGSVTLFSHVSYQTINTRLIFVKHFLRNSSQSCLEKKKEIHIRCVFVSHKKVSLPLVFVFACHRCRTVYFSINDHLSLERITFFSG